MKNIGKVVELVGGGSVFNGAYPVYFPTRYKLNFTFKNSGSHLAQ